MQNIILSVSEFILAISKPYLCDTVAKWKFGIQLSRRRSNWNASD